MSDASKDPFDFEKPAPAQPTGEPKAWPMGNPFTWAESETTPDGGLADLMGSPEADAVEDGPAPIDASRVAEIDRKAAEVAAEMVLDPGLEEIVDDEVVPEMPVDPTEVPDPVEPAEARTADEAQPALKIESRKLQALRLLLIGNVVMIAVMLALPHPLETRPEYRSDDQLPMGGAVAIPGTDREPVVTLSPRPVSSRSELGLPDDAAYEQALLLGMDGRFDEAAESLQGYLADHPDLNPPLQRLVHAHLGYYLRKAGRVSEAITHENEMRTLAGRASLPDELLQSARAAEQSGDGVAMRQAYARFLLQREQLSPVMRELVEEAYLELGDSYRVEADAAEETQR